MIASNAVSRVLEGLARVRKCGEGWTALCPSHDDRNPSLSVSQGEDGRALLKCHAGCTLDAICEALGIKVADLFEPPRGSAREGFSSAEAAMEAATGILQRDRGAGWRLTQAYGYIDAGGRERMRVLRFESADGSAKTFRPIHPDGGLWWIGDPPGPLPLYRLPSVVGESEVVVCEGEKAADAAAAIGLASTTAAHGANAERRTDWTPLAGKTVTILPDNDDPGRGWAYRVARILSKADEATIVRIVPLPDLPQGGDIVEYVAAQREAGLTDSEIRAAMLALAADCAPFCSVDDARERAADVTVGDPSGTADEARDKEPDFRTLSLTQLALGRLIRQRHGADMRFCHPWRRWLTWDGTRWTVDVRAVSQQNATETIEWLKSALRREFELLERLGDAARDEEYSNRLDRLWKDVHTCESVTQRSRALESLSWEREMPVVPDDLNGLPMVLNLMNGTLDLQTLELAPHRRDDLLSQLVPAKYVPDAECPHFTAFVEEMVPDTEVRAFLRRLFGYSLIGEVREHVLVFLHGRGKNGKSTLLNAFMNALGPDYSGPASPKLLVKRNHDEHLTEIADLFGKRLVACAESGEGARLDEEKVKWLTGGDRLTARRMREDLWSFTPSHTIWLVSNHQPAIRGTDDGIWRRIVQVPFDAVPKKVDPQLGEKLRQESEGIRAWGVAGLQDYLDRGLDVPESVRLSTDRYRAQEDVVGRFLTECVAWESGARTRASDLYGRYERWCREAGETPLNSTGFGKDLAHRGIEKVRSNGMSYLGVRLL